MGGGGGEDSLTGLQPSKQLLAEGDTCVLRVAIHVINGERSIS